MTQATTQGVILFAHGAREPAWAEPFERLQRLLHQRTPERPTEVAYLEYMQPDLATAVGRLAARGVERITLVPLFLGRGGHLQRDLPERVAVAAAMHPGVLIRTTRSIGEVDALLAAMVEWIMDETNRTERADLGHPLA